MTLSFFEDDMLTRFHPLTLTRPVDELRCGAFTIREKWLRYLKTELFSRADRHPVTDYYPVNEQQNADAIIHINARCLPDSSLADQISDLEVGEALTKESFVIAARSGAGRTNFRQVPDFAEFEKKETENGILMSAVTDLFTYNGQEIIKDAQWFGSDNSAEGQISPHAVIDNRDNLIMQTGAVIEPTVVLDTSRGPVILQEGARIMASSVVQGPAVIGPESVVKSGTRFYKDTTLGPVCKIGGEVSNVVMQGYSNKAHDGYLGNSVIGEWCNLGADTTSSNLKNNYSFIKLRDWATRKPYDTGLQFCGVLMGDHTKTSINAMLNTGSQFGVNCNIIAGKFPPTFLPSFSWFGVDDIYVYQIDKALETARRVMQRRNIELTSEYERMMRQIFELRQ